jgi:hypothetical protein
MAGSAVFPLLKYEPSVLAVTAVVCGAHLVVKQSHKDVKMDEGLNNGLAELCGVDVARTLECRKEVVQFINLDNLVLTNVEAQAIMAGESPCRGRSGSRLASWVHTTVGTAANSPPPPCTRAPPPLRAERAKKRQERLRRRKGPGEFHIRSPAPPPHLQIQQQQAAGAGAGAAGGGTSGQQATTQQQ